MAAAIRFADGFTLASVLFGDNLGRSTIAFLRNNLTVPIGPNGSLRHCTSCRVSYAGGGAAVFVFGPGRRYG
ncbi:hypothetical protein D3C81_2130150 [compost metagenome]